MDELYASQEQVSQDNVLVDVPGAKGVEVYFFAGPHMNQAVQRYNLYSGGGAMPPVWGLGRASSHGQGGGGRGDAVLGYQLRDGALDRPRARAHRHAANHGVGEPRDADLGRTRPTAAGLRREEAPLERVPSDQPGAEPQDARRRHHRAVWRVHARRHRQHGVRGP